MQRMPAFAKQRSRRPTEVPPRQTTVLALPPPLSPCPEPRPQPSSANTRFSQRVLFVGLEQTQKCKNRWIRSSVSARAGPENAGAPPGWVGLSRHPAQFPTVVNTAYDMKAGRH